MPKSQRKSLEAEIRSVHQAGDMTNAATIAVKGYGSEIFSYLAAVLRDEVAAGDLFEDFCEAMWLGLPGFRWECSFRTWAYTLARHALSRLQRDPQRKLGKPVPLSRSPELNEMAQKVRTTTVQHLRTEAKDRIARLRDQLAADEQTLLIFRVDRRMSWEEIAAIMSEEHLDTEGLKKRAAALRKQFERIKSKLRDLAKSHTE